MRKFLGTITLAILVLAVIGYSRGWFAFTTNSESEKTKIEVTIDKDRLKADTDRLKDGVQDLSEKFTDGSEGEPSGAASNLGDPDLILPPGN